jgi:hypothetical protein
MSNSFEKKSKKPQKVIIDMSNAWTEEDKKRSPEKWAEIENSYKEKNEYPKKLEKVREYIGGIIDTFNDEATKLSWQETEADLDCGNERAVMERLEYMTEAERSTSKTKKDVELWRGAIFEISKEVNSSASFVDAETVGKSFYDEFTKLQEEMNRELDSNPGAFSERDRKDYEKQVLRWHDASNELLTIGRSENALILLEQEIEDKVRYDHDLRGEIEQAAKSKNANIEYINRTKEIINANSKKLAAYRRMRDSLYAIEFSK